MIAFQIRNILMVFPFIAFLTGCAGTSLKTETISLNEDPNQQIELMKSELKDARDNDIHTLSPNWYQKSKKSYDLAKALHVKGGSLKDIFKNLSKSRAQIERAKKLAPVAQVVLVPVIKARNLALQAGANESTKGFDRAEQEYLNLTALVEKDKREEAEKKSSKVRAMYSKLELEAITDRALNPARNRLKEAISLKAKKMAPKTLTQAEKRIATAAQFIAKNRYDDKRNAKEANAALFMADRAVMVTKETLKIKSDSPETSALRIESMTERIASNLDLPDIRNLGFAVQTNEIVKSIGNVKDVRDSLEGKSVNLESEIRKITGAHESQVSQLESEQSSKLDQLRLELEKEESLLARLRKERKFEELLKSVDRDFSPDEAEVSRQGNKLVFRLKGADFPVGESIIPTKNYPLLAKVTASIKKFNNAKIVVEGHTDSIGTAETNEKLSELRAKNVSDYLIAHGGTLKGKVKTVGFGYKRPIATNKTREGRKKNRRIDIIVEPNSQ